MSIESIYLSFEYLINQLRVKLANIYASFHFEDMYV